MRSVTVKSYPPPPYNDKEIFRYMGALKPSAAEEQLVNEAKKIAEGALSYRVCFARFPYSEDMSGGSEVVKRCLSGAEEIILCAVTVGFGIDRLIMKYSSRSPSLALALQALGAERAESLLDSFSADMERELSSLGKTLLPRFSAGYGDFSLDNQKRIAEALDMAKNIGVTLNDSLLMSPTKSITAIIGICGEKQ